VECVYVCVCVCMSVCVRMCVYVCVWRGGRLVGVGVIVIVIDVGGLNGGVEVSGLRWMWVWLWVCP